MQSQGTATHAISISTVILAVALAVPLLGGCAPEPQSPTAGLTKPVDPPVPPDLGRAPGITESEGPYNMYVAEGVRTVCSGPDPFFAFDSASPSNTDQPTMQTLVTCMRTGALRGRSIRLVGHTDPRGTPNFNEGLGLQRAQKVKAFLVSRGIEEDRILVATMGAEDASHAPEHWATDRRVAIQLVP